MEEKLITFETAKLAKEKGFDEEVKGAYNKNGNSFLHLGLGKNSHLNLSEQNIISAPTQSLLQKWLRDIHKLNVIIYPSFNCYNIKIKKYNADDDLNISLDLNRLEFKDFNIYEEALEEGLKQALTLI